VNLSRQWRLPHSDAAGRNADSHAHSRRHVEEEDDNVELDEMLDYSLLPSTRVIVSEGGSGSSIAIASKTIGEWDGTDTSLLPEWMVRSIEQGYATNDRGEPTGDAPKIGFHLVRHPTSDMKQMQQGKLNAPQILRGRKVLSYAVSKLSLEISSIPPHMRRPGYDQVVDYLELLCHEKLVPPGLPPPPPPPLLPPPSSLGHNLSSLCLVCV